VASGLGLQLNLQEVRLGPTNLRVRPTTRNAPDLKALPQLPIWQITMERFHAELQPGICSNDASRSR
jgi:hypothetical protein